MDFVRSQRYIDREIGQIHITVRSNATNFKARWKGAELQVTLPQGVTIEAYNSLLEKFRKDIIASKPNPRYYDGQHFDFDGYSIDIYADKSISRLIRVMTRDGGANILVADDIPFDDTWVEKKISEDICYVARHYAQSLVIDLAEEVSRQLGVHPREYRISHGARTLGRCYTSRRIDLSSRLALLPEDLRRFVICHELAHLSEMNHSPRFHAIVNEYTDGREAELNAKLRKHKWPILK